MKIKLLTARVGMDFSQTAGEIIDLPEDDANSLVSSGQAEPVEEKKVIEAPENKSLFSSAAETATIIPHKRNRKRSKRK